MLSPLDQLYLETTSKEDLLAEINDQRRQVVEARGEWAKADRELQELRAELSRVKNRHDALCALVSAKDNQISRLRKKHNDFNVRLKPAIIELITSGLSNKEIEAKGFNGSTIRALRSELKKAAT